MENVRLFLRQDRTRTLAERTGSIVERYASKPEVSKVGTTVVPLAAGYISKHEALKTKRLVTRAATQAGRAAVAELHARQRMWRGALARELPGFERTEVDAPVSNPDGVLADAKQLVAFVNEKGGELPYASVIVNDLTRLIERTEPAWKEAQKRLAELQELQAELRSIGARFLSGLVILRIVLRTVLGAQHRDYQALRARRRSEDTEVPEIEEAADVVTAGQPAGTATEGNSA